ncbi:hypothetical protein LTS18_013278, partial [Coniosporium uncinatum]
QQQTSSQAQPVPLKQETNGARDSQPRVEPLKSGLNYPEVRSSTVDLSAIPTHTSTGKPITEVDIDADLAEHQKPWRAPGADQSDYFNYGFDEFTWATYCLKQQNMASQAGAIRAENDQFQKMLGGMGMAPPAGMAPSTSPAPTAAPNTAAASGGGAMGGMSGATGGMPGIPGEDAMWGQMMQYMQAQGINDPSQMDFGAFMSAMGGGMPGGGMPGQGQQQVQQQGYGGGYGQQQGYAQGGHQGGYGGGAGGGGGGGRGRGRRW